AEELVDPVPDRIELGPPSQMPLADQRRAVTGRAQLRRDRRMTGGDPHFGRAVREWLLEPDRKARRIAARDKRAARRRADRRGRVVARELEALLRERIEHRRLV